jgi:hypothetical protein
MVCTSRYVKERAGDCVEKIEKRMPRPYRRVHDCFMDRNTWNKDDNYKLCKNSILRTNIKQRGNYLCFIETVFGSNFRRIILTFDGRFVHRAFTQDNRYPEGLSKVLSTTEFALDIESFFVPPPRELDKHYLCEESDSHMLMRLCYQMLRARLKQL